MSLYFHFFFCTLEIKYDYFRGLKELVGFSGGSVVKNLPAMQETQVRSLGWKDSLEKEMATHSSILAWRIPWMEEPGNI